VPIARPLASRALSQPACNETDFEPVTTPKDSLSLRPSRISSSQLEAIASDLTDLDHRLLQFVADQRIASGHQLRRRFLASSDGRAVRRLLLRLIEWRVLERLPRRVGGIRSGSDGFVYAVGVAGARLLARDGRKLRRLETPGDRYIAHTLAITELVVRLHEAQRRGELDLMALQAEPGCWRTFTGPAGTRLVLKPDLYVNLGAGDYEDRWFIEVDLATEARGTLQAKAKRYVAHLRSGDEGRVYPRVLWVVPSEHRMERVRSALGALPVEHQRLFTYITFEDGVGLLAAEARV
jgi:Replication-relaxation